MLVTVPRSMIGASGLGVWALRAICVVSGFESAPRLHANAKSARQKMETNALAMRIVGIFIERGPLVGIREAEFRRSSARTSRARPTAVSLGRGCRKIYTCDL